MRTQTDHTQFAIQLDVTFRKLCEDDLPKLEWYGEFKHFRNLFRRSYQGQLRGERLMLVADVNDFPIGRLFIQYGHKGRSRLSDGRSKGYLYSFHLMEIFRGKGIGTQLIHTAEDILIRQNYSWATISVTKDNEGALRLYQGQGYSIFGEDEGKWHYHDHHGMVRYVHEPSFLLKKRL
ncbi:MAG: hypothetical protein Phog2KO_07940 [Phototrophicaceae bacterium]